MKKLLLIIAVICTVNNIKAQTPQLSLWSIPPEKITFTGTNPAKSLLPTQATGYTDYGSPSEAFNSMYDKNGNLLFFVTQDAGGYLKVFDKLGNTIYDVNGNSVLKFDYVYQTTGNVWVTVPGHAFTSWAKELVIVPAPGNCNKYYIITGAKQEHDVSNAISYIPVYATLDLSLSTNGAILAATSTSNLNSLATMTGVTDAFMPYGPGHKYRFGITTTPYRSGNSIKNYLYIYGVYALGAKGFFKYKIDQTGISYASIETPTVNPPVFYSYSDYYAETELVKLASGNYRLARVMDNVNIYWCDLDFTNGSIISGTEHNYSFGAGKSLHGLEFSPDGNFIYYSYDGSTDKAGYLNTSTSVATDFLTQTVGFIEMGYDGKMYFSSADHLFARTNPNTPGSGSWNYNTTPYAIGLSPDDQGAGDYTFVLPDQIDGNVYYYPNPIIAASPTGLYACETTAETYTISNYISGVTYTWTAVGGTINGPTLTTLSTTNPSINVTWGANGGTLSVVIDGNTTCDVPTITVNPCCRQSIAGYTTIYLNNKTESASATYTASSNNGSTTGAPFVYVVNGNYTVNANAVTFSGCETFFATNSQVTINNPGYLKLQSGTVWKAGCGAMWNGIIINAGGANLLVDNSTIQDAKLAIDSKNGAPFTVQNGSKLNLNYRNIFFEAYSGGTHPGVIKNSTISCVNASNVPVTALLPPYNTGGSYSGRTYMGIETNSVTQVNIGVAAAGQTNTFNHMDIGIYNYATNLTVYNNNFTNIIYNGTGPRGRGIFSINPTTGAEKSLIVGGTAAYQTNSFTNSFAGILMQYNQDASIVSNTFNNLDHTAIYDYYCYGAGNNISILSNTIDDCLYGLFLVGSKGSQVLDVRLNNINSAAPTANSKPNSKGMFIPNPSLSVANAPLLTVINNTIKRVSTGIEVTYFTAPSIELNTITAMSDLGSSIQSYGVLLNTCTSINVRTNTVVGPGASAWYTNGIRVESCTGPGSVPSSTILYNTVENVGSGLFFGGTCTGTETAKNLMKNNYWGMVINYGSIGYQNGSPSACKATENAWQGTFLGSHIHSYGSDGTTSTTNLYGTACSTASAPCTNPSPFVSSVGAVAPGVFAVPTQVCATASGRSFQSDGLDVWRAIAKGQNNYPAYTASAKWMNQYALYHALKNDSSLLDDADIRAFADSVHLSTMDQLMELENTMVQNNYNTPPSTNTLSTMQTNNVVEQNLKEVYSITMAQQSNNGLTNQQIAKLKQIAKQCAYEGGQGVYSARVLLSTVDNTYYTNECENPKPEKNRSVITNTDYDNETYLYPNPANDKVYISIATTTTGEQAGSIEVYDLTGKKVLSAVLKTAEQHAELSTASLSEGLYIYKIYMNNSCVDTGKLSIVR